MFSLREIAFALANLAIAVILFKHCAYIESEDSIRTFIGWVERNDFPDVEKIRSLETSQVADSKISGGLIYSDFKRVIPGEKL